MAFTVSLNGNNYISDKRKKAFQTALEDDKKVKPGGNGQKPVSPTPQTLMRDAHAYPVENTAPPLPQTNHDYSRMFESLELGLTQSYGHQSETLQVHQQYLHNQAEYAAIFSQLMQQQGTLFSNNVTSPEQAEVTLVVLKSLAKSIEQFHQHQTETLNVHNQFLNQQSQYAQEFVQLLRQQYNGSNGDSDGSKHNQPAVQPTRYETPEKPALERFESERLQVVQTLPVRSQDVRERVAPAVPELTASVETAVITNELSSAEAAPAAHLSHTNTFDNGVLTQMLLSIVSEKTGYPAEMLELDMDMEADLGIDSIKRVEIMGALQDNVPDMPEIDTDVLAGLRTLAQIISYVEQQEEKSGTHDVSVQNDSSEATAMTPETILVNPSIALDAQELKTALLEIVSEKTGYPAEMLELDMDMEADLGIDSIKRVEILGALQDVYPTMPEIDADTLGTLRTLQQIIGYIDVREHAEKKV